MKVIFDSNVLISGALIKNSKPDLAFRKAKVKDDFLSSTETLKELFRKLLQEKFNKYLPIKSRLEYLVEFKDISKIIEVNHSVSICRDPKDNMYLELDLSGWAGCIITGDKDLLALHPFENIPIVSPSDFLDNY